MKCAYPAVFTPEENGMYSVDFPDLHNCYTSGDNLTDAIYMAEDVLAFTLYDLENEGAKIPVPSKPSDIALKENEFVNFIACDTLKYRKKLNSKAVKKTLTIPEWLNDIAMADDINFSQVLQEALMQKLNIK